MLSYTYTLVCNENKYQDYHNSQVLWDFVKSFWTFWMTSYDNQRLLWELKIGKKKKATNKIKFVVSAVPADGLAKLGAKTSAGRVMTNVGSWGYTAPAHEGSTYPCALETVDITQNARFMGATMGLWILSTTRVPHVGTISMLSGK